MLLVTYSLFIISILGYDSYVSDDTLILTVVF